MLPVSALIPILVVALILVIASCVYADAKTLRDRGTPVVLTTNFLVIDTPGLWAALCLVTVVLVLPIYLAIRRELR